MASAFLASATATGVGGKGAFWFDGALHADIANNANKPAWYVYLCFIDGI